MSNSELVRVEFIYRDGADDSVLLVGDWNGWKSIQMRKEEKSDTWSVVTYVPPGAHEFKFIVDGKWKYSRRHAKIGVQSHPPQEEDFNNIRFVRSAPDISSISNKMEAGSIPDNETRGSELQGSSLRSTLSDLLSQFRKR